MWAHFLVVILLYDRSSNYHIDSIGGNNLVEFFEDMLNTLDSPEGSRKENIRMLQIRFILISFEVGTLYYSVYILGDSELFQYSLSSCSHSLADRNNTLAPFQALLHLLALLTPKGVICISTCNYQNVGYLHSHPRGRVSSSVDYPC